MLNSSWGNGRSWGTGRNKGTSADRLTLVAVALTLLAGTSAHAQTSYRYTDLGTLGGTNSYARDANEAGYVVGYSAVDANSTRAALWQPGSTTPLNLGTLSYAGNSYAHGINNSNEVNEVEVVGYAEGATLDIAFVWDPLNRMRDLNDLNVDGFYDHPEWKFLYARQINDNRQVLGGGHRLQPDGTWVDRVFLLDLNTSEVNEVLLPGALSTDTRDLGLNKHGQAVATAWLTSEFFSPTSRAGILYHKSTGAVQLQGLFTARDINDDGAIVGTAATSGWSQAAYRHPSDGSLTTLGSLGNKMASAPLSINTPTNGRPVTVVGIAQNNSGLDRAFRWQVGNTKMVDLNGLTTGKPRGWFLIRAGRVTNNGVIVGHASDGSVTHAFKLTPQ